MPQEERKARTKQRTAIAFEMRAQGKTFREIAERLQVSRSRIWQLFKRQQWLSENKPNSPYLIDAMKEEFPKERERKEWLEAFLKKTRVPIDAKLPKPKFCRRKYIGSP